jgi:hypothetical protein
MIIKMVVRTASMGHDDSLTFKFPTMLQFALHKRSRFVKVNHFRQISEFTKNAIKFALFM